MDVDCCSIQLSYFCRSGRADLNRQPTVPITHNLRPAERPTDKKRTGNTCSTTELLRRCWRTANMHTAKIGAGGRTRTGDHVVMSDNPILRPVVKL